MGPSADAARVMELVDRLGEPSKLVVKEELGMVAVRLNMAFLACEAVGDVAALAATVYRRNPSLVAVLHRVVQEGDPCMHIVLELLYHLTFSPTAWTAIVDAGVVDTLVGVLPALTVGGGGPSFSTALQLLDRITDDHGSSDRGRRRLVVQRLCRVACVRVLWDVLATTDSPMSSSSFSTSLSLLAKITTAIETAQASGAVAAATGDQVVRHTLQRTPLVEKLLVGKIVEDDQAAAGPQDPHAARAIARRIQRWRQASRHV